MTLIASIITFSKKKKLEKKMLPSTLDLVPSPSTLNPRPSTLDPRQKDRLLITWRLWFGDVVVTKKRFFVAHTM